MRKIILSAVIGLSLLAASASMAAPAYNRIVDRVGASSADSDELTGVPLTVLTIGTVVATLVLVSSDDNSESD